MKSVKAWIRSPTSPSSRASDIGATKNVRMVIKDGQVMDTSYDPAWVHPILFCAVCHKGWEGQQEMVKPAAR